MLSIFPLRDFQFINFNISFFLTENDGNKALQLFCAIPVAMVFFIYLYLSCNDNYFVFSLYDDEINLPTLLSKHCINSVYDSFYHHVVHHEKTEKIVNVRSFVNKILFVYILLFHGGHNKDLRSPSTRPFIYCNPTFIDFLLNSTPPFYSGLEGILDGHV